MPLAQKLTLFSRLLREPRVSKKPVTLPRRLRESDTRERMKAALNLLHLREARVSHAGFSANPVVFSNKVHATDESLDSASVEELAAMEEATRNKYERIVSELKKRDGRKHVQGNVGEPASDMAHAPASATTRAPRRSGRLTTSGTSEGHQGAGAENQANPNMNGTEQDAAQSRVEQAATAADGRAPSPASNQKDARHDDESSVAQVVSNTVDAAVASVVGEDATSTTDTIASMAANAEQKIDQDPTSQAAIDSALTPVSEANKDGDDQTLAVTNVKPVISGVETPETEPNVPDQATSPADAMELDRDRPCEDASRHSLDHHSLD